MWLVSPYVWISIEGLRDRRGSRSFGCGNSFLSERAYRNPYESLGRVPHYVFASVSKFSIVGKSPLPKFYFNLILVCLAWDLGFTGKLNAVNFSFT